jgi:hypothetical protein
MLNKTQALVLALMLTTAPGSGSLAQVTRDDNGGGVGGPVSLGAPLSGVTMPQAGRTGVQPDHGGSNSVETPTGSAAGPGTGLGIGSTSTGQPSTQTSVGAPNGPSTTPGGPPTPDTSNMTGTGAASGR